jgi:hypothetical protein
MRSPIIDFAPPKSGCPINDLPEELLSYIFEVGVQDEAEGEDDSSEAEEEEWDTEDEAEGEAGAAMVKEVKAKDVDAEMIDEDDDEFESQLGMPSPPFQVLVSHVCRKWRSTCYNEFTELVLMISRYRYLDPDIMDPHRA